LLAIHGGQVFQEREVEQSALIESGQDLDGGQTGGG